MPHSLLSELRTLSRLIALSIEQLEAAATSPDSPLHACSSDDPTSLEKEASWMTTEAQEASDLIVAAASQMIAIARPPQATLYIAGAHVRTFVH